VQLGRLLTGAHAERRDHHQAQPEHGAHHGEECNADRHQHECRPAEQHAIDAERLAAERDERERRNEREVGDDTDDGADDGEHRRLDDGERRDRRGRRAEQPKCRQSIVAPPGREARRGATQRSERHDQQYERDHGKGLVGHADVVGPGPERLRATEHGEQKCGHDPERRHRKQARCEPCAPRLREQPRDPADHDATAGVALAGSPARSPAMRPSRMSTMREQPLATFASCVTSTRVRP
jgi:hypothetical protein